jgi:cytochrome c oxidase subunit 4
MESISNVSMATLTRVYLGLMLLLGATVAASFAPLGAWGPAVSIAIAFAKTFLVVYFFMKLREASAGLRIVAFAGVFWLFLLGSITVGDYLTRISFGVLGK